MDPERLAIEARLTALEFFLARTFAAMTRSMTDEQFDRISANWMQGIERQTFPGLDPTGAGDAKVREELAKLLDGAKAARKGGR